MPTEPTKATQPAPRPQPSRPVDMDPSRAVEPLATKEVRTATAEDVERATTDLPAPPKAIAEAQGEVPVSAAVEEGDDVVRRNDVQGTLGPVAAPTQGRMSEGVRADLEQAGAAVDPLTGRVLTREDLPKSRGGDEK